MISLFRKIAGRLNWAQDCDRKALKEPSSFSTVGSGLYSNCPTVIHVTHWKAGSQWINRILHALAPERIVPPTNQEQDQFFRTRIIPGMIYPTIYATREEYDRVLIPENHRRFVIIRDLRDTLVSLYFSVKVSHVVPNIKAEKQRRLLNDRSMEFGMFYTMENILPLCADIQASWRESGETIVRFEDLLTNDLNILESILLGTCQLEIGIDELRNAVIMNRFEKLTGGRPRGVEDVQSHERKGVSGDWKTYFSSSLKASFKARFGDLLVATGYENDASW